MEPLIRKEQQLVENPIIGGKKATKNWLSNCKPIDEYRANLHLAFQKAQMNYQLRSKNNIKKLENQAILRSQEFSTLIQDYKQVDPEISDQIQDKLKLSKLSRSCSKSMLDRYFTVDQSTESIVYYKKQEDSKPKKKVSLGECRIYIESLEENKVDYKENKLTQWTELNKKFRLEIRLKNRQFQPVYHYVDNRHQAILIQANVEAILNHEKNLLIGQWIALLSEIFKVSNFTRPIKLMNQMRYQIKRQKDLIKSLFTIQCHFEQERIEKIAFIDKEVRRVKDIEHREYLKAQEAERKRLLEEQKLLMVAAEPIEEIKEPERIPEIYSTFRKGMVNLWGHFYFKMYTKGNRSFKRVTQLFKDHHQDRHPVIQDLINKQMDVKLFTCQNGSYRIHDQVLENMNKIGEIPYLIQDLSSIAAVRVEGENLVLIDKKKHEYLLPLNEINFICTDIRYQQPNQQNQQSWKLQLRGRKINSNVEMIGENILPSQIGQERFKYSRLVDKTVLQFSLKKIQIPLYIQNILKERICNRKNQLAFRLKFEIGDFHCYSKLFSSGHFSTITLKDEITLDIHDFKIMKITLLAVIGRLPPNNQYVNEFCNEQIISYVSLRMRDFENNELALKNEMLHAIEFNNQFYNPKDPKPNKIDQTILSGAFVITQLVEEQPTNDIYQRKIIDNVNVKADIKAIERYGISIINIQNKPQNYLNGQFEWSLDLQVNNNENELLRRIYLGIQEQQLKLIYNQRLHGFSVRNRNQAFVCGRLFISVMNAQNLANKEGALCDSYVQVSIGDPKNQSNAKFIDIANEQSFIMCKKNSEESANKTYKTSIVKQNNNPQWVSGTNPHGETFDIGMFMKRFPHSILIEVYNQKKKSRFSSEIIEDLIGFAEVQTEDLILLDNYGQEFYLFLEDSANRSSLIKIRTLFVPSLGTIERMNLDTTKSLFKNAQQYLFYKVLHEHELYDEYGYRVPLGKYLTDFSYDDSLLGLFGYQTRRTNIDINSSLIQDADQFQKRYERFSPEHKKHKQLQDINHLRPKIEQNVYLFKQIWLYYQYMTRNNALDERQRVFWEEFMNDLMRTADEDGYVDDEFKSIRSKLTNTTKMISSKYRKRSRQLKSQNPLAASQKEGSIKNGLEETKGQRFSVLFVGQWEKEQSWKYVDIWYLIKFGIPKDLRVSLWKDLLRRQINEQQIHQYIKRNAEFSQFYNGNISNYENLKIFSTLRDSTLYQQIEQDIKSFKFPRGYLKNQNSFREDRWEEERLCMNNIFKAYATWAHEFTDKRQKILMYNKGLLSLVQRFLSFMNEEDAFWTLVGMTKAFNNVLIFDYKEPKDQKISQYQTFSAMISRRVSYKNEMNILICLIKLHYPQIFEHLKSLSVPFEFYFYDAFSKFFTESFSTDIILRLWDMIVFNLSTNTIDNRKRALWYLLAIPLYMIQANIKLILKSNDPVQIKRILLEKTAAINYNPNLFIDELLTIIKQVFVKKETVINKLLKNDKAYQLEDLRMDVEMEAVKRFKESQDQHKQIVKLVIENQLDLSINSKLLNQQQNPSNIQVQIELIAFRNLFKQQLDPEKVQIVMILNADEMVTSETFEVYLPLNNDQSMYQKIAQRIFMRTSIVNLEENKKIQIKFKQIQNNVHQIDLGAVYIKLEEIVSTPSQQLFSLRVVNERLQSFNNPYADFKITTRVQQQKDKTTMLAKTSNSEEKDIHLNDRDEEVFKTIDSQRQSDKQNDKSLEGFIPYFFNPQILKSILDNLKLEPKEFWTSRYIIKLIAQNPEITVKQMLEIIFNAFQTTKDKMSHQILVLLIQNIYNSMYYPIPINEVEQLINIHTNQSIAGISRVTQQQSVEAFIQSQGFISKLFQKQQPTLQSYDITNQFKQTLNSVIRSQQNTEYIDLSQDPFHNINFWLKGQNQLKKEEQIVNVFYRTQNGDEISYSYNVNAKGFFEGQNLQLPIKLNGLKLYNKTEFLKIIERLPLISNVLRQEIFLRDQLFGSQEAFVDADMPYRFKFQALNNKKFMINFNPRIDKQDDFTVDPSQLMRIAKGDVDQIYKKSRDEQGNTLYVVMLSALSRQDAFIMVKHRMKQVIDFIAQSENLGDSIPNIMSEKFKIRKSVPDYMSNNLNSHYYYDSMDRINVESDQKATEFELVRVQISQEKEIDQYDCFALYTHPSGLKEWRPCKIKMKFLNKESQQKSGLQILNDMSYDYAIEFLHEREYKITYNYKREDVLLSFEYKRNQDYYYKEEVQEFLDKLDSEEVNIAEVLAEQDKRGMHGAGGMEEIKKQLQYGGEEGLKIGNNDLDEDKDEEMQEIKALEKEDEGSSFFSGGI